MFYRLGELVYPESPTRTPEVASFQKHLDFVGGGMGWGDHQVFGDHPQMRLFLVTQGEFEREITNSLLMHHGRQFSVQWESPS